MSMPLNSPSWNNVDQMLLMPRQIVKLHCQEGTSDKVYNIYLSQLVAQDKDKDHIVTFEYGRRGSSLKEGTKTNAPVDYFQAVKIFNDLINEKRKKGYQLVDSFSDTRPIDTKVTEKLKEKPPVEKKLPPVELSPVYSPKCVLLNPITQDEADNLIANDDWMIQEKMDGVRFMIEAEVLPFGSEFKGYNRTGKDCKVPKFIVDDFELLNLEEKVLLDGELIGDKFHVFDILELGNKDLRGMGFKERYEILNRLNLNSDYINTVEAYDVRSIKQKIFDSCKTKEGVVFKNKNAPYRVGRPSSGGDYLKFKFCDTCTCMVIKVGNKRSVGIGLTNGNDIVEIGNVTIPVNFEMPDVGNKVEVKYLYAHKGGSLIQPVYLGERDDVEVDHIDDIKYKSAV